MLCKCLTTQLYKPKALGIKVASGWGSVSDQFWVDTKGSCLCFLCSTVIKPRASWVIASILSWNYSSSSMLLFYSYLCVSVVGHSWRPKQEELTLSVSRVLEQPAEYADILLDSTPCCCLLHCHCGLVGNLKAAPSLASVATLPLAPQSFESGHHLVQYQFWEILGKFHL